MSAANGANLTVAAGEGADRGVPASLARSSDPRCHPRHGARPYLYYRRHYREVLGAAPKSCRFAERAGLRKPMRPLPGWGSARSAPPRR